MKNQPNENPAPKKRAKRAPRTKTFLIENGVWTELTLADIPTPKRLSKTGEWLRDHRSIGEIVDMRAVLK